MVPSPSTSSIYTRRHLDTRIFVWVPTHPCLYLVTLSSCRHPCLLVRPMDTGGTQVRGKYVFTDLYLYVAPHVCLFACTDTVKMLFFFVSFPRGVLALVVRLLVVSSFCVFPSFPSRVRWISLCDSKFRTLRWSGILVYTRIVSLNSSSSSSASSSSSSCAMVTGSPARADSSHSRGKKSGKADSKDSSLLVPDPPHLRPRS